MKNLDALSLTSRATLLHSRKVNRAKSAKSSESELITTQSGSYLKLLSQEAVTA